MPAEVVILLVSIATFLGSALLGLTMRRMSLFLPGSIFSGTLLAAAWLVWKARDMGLPGLGNILISILFLAPAGFGFLTGYGLGKWRLSVRKGDLE